MTGGGGSQGPRKGRFVGFFKLKPPSAGCYPSWDARNLGLPTIPYVSWVTRKTREQVYSLPWGLITGKIIEQKNYGFM